MYGPVLLLMLVAVAIGFAWWSWWNNPKHVTKRRLRETPRSNIVEVRDGDTVKVIGQLCYVGAPLRAPLSGRACAYYEVRVQEHRGKNNWRTIVEDAAGGQFLIQDDTGKALVKLEDLSTAVVEDVKLTSGFLNDPSPTALALLAKHGQSSTTFIGTNKSIRYFEGVLEEGESIAVYGKAKWETDPDPERASEGYREKPKRLRITAPSQGSMLVSDDPEATA